MLMLRDIEKVQGVEANRREERPKVRAKMKVHSVCIKGMKSIFLCVFLSIWADHQNVQPTRQEITHMYLKNSF